MGPPLPNVEDGAHLLNRAEQHHVQEESIEAGNQPVTEPGKPGVDGAALSYMLQTQP